MKWGCYPGVNNDTLILTIRKSLFWVEATNYAMLHIWRGKLNRPQVLRETSIYISPARLPSFKILLIITGNGRLTLNDIKKITRKTAVHINFFVVFLLTFLSLFISFFNFKYPSFPPEAFCLRGFVSFLWYIFQLINE